MAVSSESEKKQNTKIMNIYMGALSGVVFGYFFGYVGSLMDEEGVDLFSSVQAIQNSIMEGNFLYPITGSSIMGFIFAALAGVFVSMLLQISSDQNYSFTKDAVSGTGGFMTSKQLKEYKQLYMSKSGTYKDPLTGQVDKAASGDMILSQRFHRSMDDVKTWKNNNIFVIGGAGTGKSRFFIKPNILQLNASYVITDPSGEMVTSMGNVLKNHGYVIKIFNISDMRHSNQYNPLHYIRDEAGVIMLINCLISNTEGEGASSGDNKFFVDAERLLYAACIFYLRDEARTERNLNFATVFDMINESSVDETNAASVESELDKKIGAIKNKKDSLAYKYYSAFKQAAGRTLKAIIISCVVRLQYFQIPQVKKLTNRDDLELEEMGNRKTALFIITPQADSTYAFLSAMLYSQLFETLYHIGENRQRENGSPRFTYPIRCLMDEFANTGKVPEFPRKISTMRKYNISVSIILQDKSQLEYMYKDEWKTITANCDSWLFLGSNEPETLKYIEEKLGYQTITSKSRNASSGKGHSSRGFQQTKREVMTAEEIGRLPVDECIAFTGSGRGKDGIRPVRDKKYDYTKHPLYHETADGGGEMYSYAKMSYYDVWKTDDKVLSIMEAREEAIKYGEKMEAVSPDDLSINDLDAALDQIDYPQGLMQSIFAKTITELNKYISQDGYKDPAICVIESVEHFAPKLLKDLVKKASIELSLPSLVIFADNSGTTLCGCGIGIADAYAPSIDEFFSKNASDKEEYHFDPDKMYLFKIHRDRLAQFKQLLQQKK